MPPSASTGDDQALLALLFKKKKKPAGFIPAGFFITRQRPTFPLPHGSSSIGLGGLNFRVRDGNGCGLSAGVTRIHCTSEDVISRRLGADEVLTFISAARRLRDDDEVDLRTFFSAAAHGSAVERGQALDH